MANYFDISPFDWARGKEEMRSKLRSVAEARGLIPYGELSNSIKTLYLEPHGQPMSEMLGEVAEEEDAAGRGMLTVLVVHKADQQPGVGFCDLAEKLGKDTSDRMKLWVSELNKVYESWPNSKP